MVTNEVAADKERKNYCQHVEIYSAELLIIILYLYLQIKNSGVKRSYNRSVTWIHLASQSVTNLGEY